MANTDTRIFSDRFDDVVEENMTPTSKKALIRHIGKVLAKPRVSQGLDVSAPGTQIYLGRSGDPGDDRGEIFHLSGLEERDLKQAYKDVPYFESHWTIMSDEFNWVMTLILRRLVLDRTRERDINLVVFYLAVHFAASLIYKYFRFTPNENIMNYAINSMSNKFMLKQLGSVRKVLEHVSRSSHVTYTKNLKDGRDMMLKNYFLNMRTKLNSIFRTFKSHYENVRDEGSYLNPSKDFYDSGKMVDRESHFGIIESLAQQTAQRFTAEQLSFRLLSQASRISEVTLSSLRSILESARASERLKVQEIITKLLEIFFEEQKGSRAEINTRKFANFYLAVYIRSNTKDQRARIIKERLKQILEKHGEMYRKTEREATKNKYRKAVYIYLCLMLQNVTRGG